MVVKQRLIGAVLGFLVLAAVTGCARPATPGTAAPVAAAPGDSGVPGQSGAPAGKDVDIAVAVLRRYLGNPSENSFPGQRFPVVYVLAQTFADAADPMRKSRGGHGGVPIAQGAQQRIVAALAPTARVVFVADGDAVVETREGCAQVKDGGMLVTLGTPAGDGDKVEVGVNGFVACLGATWLTYVVQYGSDQGWQVTGTTGTSAIA
jgi:hypothetical protein